MSDRQISAACVIAWSLWAASLVIWTMGLLLDSPELRGFAIIVSAAAGTATIRTYFIAFSAMVRKAFEMDRESVRPIR